MCVWGGGGDQVASHRDYANQEVTPANGERPGKRGGGLHVKSVTNICHPGGGVNGGFTPCRLLRPSSGPLMMEKRQTETVIKRNSSEKADCHRCILCGAHKSRDI